MYFFDSATLTLSWDIPKNYSIGKDVCRRIWLQQPPRTQESGKAALSMNGVRFDPRHDILSCAPEKR
ncbi:hypothetical protein WAI453_013372 [Rhynchosporium graminicola]